MNESIGNKFDDFIILKILKKSKDKVLDEEYLYGYVAKVKSKIDGKIYAMKRINISKMDIKEREGTLNEIRILASLSHPNIIGYKEAFFDENSKTLNIVMEYHMMNRD